MDDELKNLKCNICQLAAITGLHRQTVVSRLSGRAFPWHWEAMKKTSCIS
ncbi:hypothetical protein A671_05204 [Salmonella enterica subsp. enterica serovar Dublin str. DG22]|uniref:Uncharacterized protein n=1 Tax=Salmonella enterica subsp. enterica serovar Dublin str. UC16 TaxID=1192688 RepID=M7R9P8_SALDU|nr:hypothetical protein A670_04785 [Salmonella enterica subsp. enterica serovar Dublin str. UC16]EPI63468.1 hypothetical protein A671_05204 [Salmonella enterica subsp. enterica serovar Dublin str. DG22]